MKSLLTRMGEKFPRSKRTYNGDGLPLTIQVNGDDSEWFPIEASELKPVPAYLVNDSYLTVKTEGQ